MDFIVGYLFTEDFIEEENFEDNEYEYILCKIIIGNSFCKVYENKNEIQFFDVNDMESI